MGNNHFSSDHVLLIGSIQDTLLEHFTDYLKTNQISFDLLSVEEYLSKSSLLLYNNTFSVSPAYPMFIREDESMFPSHKKIVDLDDRDKSFIAQENLAAFWSNAALSSCPVINRPTSSGLCGNLRNSIGSIEVDLWPESARTEIYCSSSQFLEKNLFRKKTNYWAYDYTAHESFLLDLQKKNVTEGPLRLRPSVPYPNFIEMLVVGDEIWIYDHKKKSIQLSSLYSDLVQQALVVMKHVKLEFAGILWCYTTSRQKFSLISLNPFPQLFRFKEVRNDMFFKICQLLGVY